MTDDVIAKALIHKVPFMLWKERWIDFQSKAKLHWNCHPFKTGERSNVPDTPGIYAFIVQPLIAGNLPVAYLMYIGESGRLRRRFNEHLESAKDGREKQLIHTYLRRYISFITFCYAKLPACISKDERKIIEDDLLAAFVPPGNEMLPAETKKIMRAFRR